MTDIRMSEWLEPSAPAPDGPAFVQVKVLGTLIDYPTGRSAMLWYGAGPSAHALVATGLEASRPIAGALPLRWRYLSDDHAERALDALAERFVRRFGALPAAMSAAYS